MRLLVLPLLLTALPTAAAAPPAPPPEAVPAGRLVARPGDSCMRDDLHRADGPLRAEAKPLGELPPGDTLLAVYREVDGCMAPAIVRYGDGRTPDAEDGAGNEPLRPPRARLWR